MRGVLSKGHLRECDLTVLIMCYIAMYIRERVHDYINLKLA